MPHMLDERRDGRVAVVTMRRPDRRNAMDDGLVARATEVFRALDADPEVGAIVLHGAAPGFCAGSDLKYIGRLSLEAMCRFEADTGAFARMLAQLDTPVVAAVEGFAMGGGFILAVSCDLVVTAQNARWHLPEVPIGWLTPWGLQALIARVGPVRARTLCFGIAPFEGAEALRLRVADQVVAPGAALEAAIAQAQRLAALPAGAAAATKRFFAGPVADRAETLDALANRMFADNCRHPSAMATLTRYGTSTTGGA
jgi:enoyl-CoA hydratase/carnithine racemase